MKNSAVVLLFALMTYPVLTGCEENSVVESEQSFNQNENAAVSVELSKSGIDGMPAEDISRDEIESLSFMREEEKLARDVYTMLYQKYSARVFNNISKSEQTHTTAIKYLIEKYKLEDPAELDEPGVFRNAELQTLYNNLIEKAGVSFAEALKVGALIEEVDILDLEKQVNEKVDNADIELVYNNLKQASENHLRAFVRNLLSNGIVYEPVYLGSDEYNLILGD